MTTLWFQTALLPTGWADRVRIEIADGLITGIETQADAGPDDARHAIAVPGLANVHSHGFQRGMAGLAEHRGREDDDFWSWREVMYRFLDRMTPDDVEAVTALAYLEMVESGFTRVGEFHYLHHQPDGRPYANVAETAAAVAAAAAQTGIGLTLLPVYYAQGDFGAAPPTPGQRRFLNDLNRFAALLEASRAAIAGLPGAALGVAPHSLRAVTPQDLAIVTGLVPPGAPIHIHAAEQVKEVDDCVAWSGARPVQWLLDHAPVDARWCLIHATHLADDEADRLAASGAVAGLCPVTEANLGDGVFPARRYLRAGGGFGVGTDSNVRVDAADELRAVEYGQRLTARKRNVLASPERPSTGAALFAGALAGGAQALGGGGGALAERALAKGAPVDIVALDAAHPSLVARRGDALLDGWIFAGRDAVDAVWCRGRQVVSEGRGHGRADILRRYRATMTRLLAA